MFLEVVPACSFPSRRFPANAAILRARFWINNEKRQDDDLSRPSQVENPYFVGESGRELALGKWCVIGLAMIHTASQALHLDLNRVNLAVFGGRCECQAVFMTDELRDFGVCAIEFLLISGEINAPACCQREFVQRSIGLSKAFLDERAILAFLCREFPPPRKLAEIARE